MSLQTALWAATSGCSSSGFRSTKALIGCLIQQLFLLLWNLAGQCGLPGMKAFLSPFLAGKTPAIMTFLSFQRADPRAILTLAKGRDIKKPTRQRWKGNEALQMKNPWRPVVLVLWGPLFNSWLTDTNLSYTGGKYYGFWRQRPSESPFAWQSNQTILFSPSRKTSSPGFDSAPAYRGLTGQHPNMDSPNSILSFEHSRIWSPSSKPVVLSAGRDLS